ncbi:MAG: DUF362 domain-containing protein [Treponema sp.]|nr:DUF362 domain-containing protein [Treponema sp.]
MKLIIKLTGIFSLVMILLSAECSNNSISYNSPLSNADSNEYMQLDLSEIPRQLISTIFVEDTDGTDDGVRRLVNSMQGHGLDFYSLIASGDVIILKINCQWAERGGTNTDLIKSVIQAITEHPGGFSGEIIVADNGQAQFGSERRGGSLSWANANSACRRQSVMDVVAFFKARGVRATGVLWDDFTGTKVEEFNSGDTKNGFVVENTIRDTGLEISYPKFVTEYGTHVSFKMGIWDDGRQVYISDKLKVINMPVLKSHGGFQVTAAVKNYMGTPSDRLTSRRAHNSVGTGGMGTQMAHTRMPVINILDMIWVGVERGPSSSYANAKQINKIAASLDPVALDYWASKNILMPEAMLLPGGRAPAMNPDGTEPGTFGRWLRLSMNEIRRAGYWVTMDETEINVVSR